MGRKKKEGAAAPAPSTGKPFSPSALKTLVEETSVFFDNLVKLIPPRFYVPGPDADDRVWFQGLSKAAKASAKKQARDNIKKSRRLRFNPQHPSSTLDLLHQSLKPSDPDESPATAAADDEKPVSKPEEEQSVTYEELRERLHRRIEELRSGRNTRPKLEPRRDDRKRKREPEEISQSAEEKQKKNDEKLADIAFGKVKIGDADEKRRKKKRVSKVQELERAKKLEELKKDPEKGESVAKKHSWKAAESRAMGMKVHDDLKLLKESIKKEKKRQKKHAEKWKERVQGAEKARKQKQQKRMDNIKDRIQQKKVRKIEKREKKLMRPGFEGRKEGFINE